MNTQVCSISAEEAPAWPGLERLGLSEAELSARAGTIGGSDANLILGGDPERLLRLWREKRGLVPLEDLSDRLPVMLGCWTEAFNRQWYERVSGLGVSRVGEAVLSTDHPWRRCTLDGYVLARGAIWEAKHTSAFTTADEVLGRYMPQLQHNMAVTGTALAVLSVIFGNHKWEVFEIASDWMYQEELLIAESRFLDCVRHGVEPVAVAPPPPPKPVGTREVSLEGSNLWADAAHDWQVHAAAAKLHANAVSTLKGLVEPDVTRAYGHGIEAKRNRAGAISIRELAA